MHPELIKAEIRMKYGSLSNFSREYGLHRQAIADLLQGRSRPKAARLVAKALGKDLNIVFPGQIERESRRAPTEFQQTIRELKAQQTRSRQKAA